MIWRPPEMPGNYIDCWCGINERRWKYLYDDSIILRDKYTGYTRSFPLKPEQLENIIKRRATENTGNYYKKAWVDGKHEFDSFFDTSLGERIESMDQIRAHEKNGLVMISVDEAKREAAKNANYIKQKEREQSREEIRQTMRQISNRNGGDWKLKWK